MHISPEPPNDRDRLINEAIQKIDSIEAQIIRLEKRGRAVSDRLLITYYNQLSAAKEELSELQLKQISELTK